MRLVEDKCLLIKPLVTFSLPVWKDIASIWLLKDLAINLIVLWINYIYLNATLIKFQKWDINKLHVKGENNIRVQLSLSLSPSLSLFVRNSAYLANLLQIKDKWPHT